MAEVIVSAVAELLVGIIIDQIQNEIQLVRGVDKEVLNLANELETLKYVLDNAENRRFQDKNINNWVSRLEQTSHEMEDVLEEWNYALLKLKMHVPPPPKYEVCSFIPSSCLCFNKVAIRRDIAKKIKNVMQQLDQILREKDRYNFVTSDRLVNSWQVQSTSFIDLEKIQGRQKESDFLVGKLTDNGELGNQILSIVGMGGLGKTTLAQLVYNDGRVEKSFDLRIWICVSDPFDPAAIAKEILESIEKGSSPNSNQLDVLLKHVEKSIIGNKFLLVLDDVWTEDQNKWEALRNTLKRGGAGSKILVTTRNRSVGKMMGLKESDICNLGFLTNEECWSLILCRIALSKRNEVEFEGIGKKLAQKCKGWPLAAITLASLLRSKSSMEEWENVLNSEIYRMEIVETGTMKVDIFLNLLLSYNNLTPTLKRCFSYCAVFPKDANIDVDELIGKWMALGYLNSKFGDLELEGRECFNVLVERSLFHDFKMDDALDNKIISCKMHDIVHDFAQFIRKGGRAEGERTNMTCQACDPISVSNVNQFFSLDWKYKESSTPLCDCFRRLRVLSMKKLPSIPQGMQNLIHLRWLNLSGNALSQEWLKIIFQFYYLKTLKLMDCSLEEVPRDIGNLIHLRDLDLSYNMSLIELPSEIGKLIQLRQLKLCHNESLEKLPSEIGNLTHLRHLDLSYTMSLTELPSEIGKLIQLRQLNLCHNESLEELPSEIGNLTHLRDLDLSYNMTLIEFPSEIGKLIQLRQLNLCRNESLEELTSEIGNLTHLRDLDLSYNMSLKELPSEIGKLIQLKQLNLCHNESLERLPSEIGNLTGLIDLDLSYNMTLIELPSEIGKLIQLKRLNLCGNESLEKLPSEIGNFTHLIDLDLSYNMSLLELPSEIGKLIQLKQLNLCHNESLEKLPSEIGNLTNLIDLDLSYNMTLIELPSEIGKLIQLRQLNLRHNESLEKLPSEIGNLTQLIYLDLSYNMSLEEMPRSIRDFHELRSLDISYCPSLSRIPAELAQLTSLQSLKGFQRESGKSKLGLLKKLNYLSGELELIIKLDNDDEVDDEVVEDAREAELRNKIHLQKLVIEFEDEMDECSNKVRMDVVDALEPHPNLQGLYIGKYKGSKLPLSWMVSPLNQLQYIRLFKCNHLSSLLPLGKLPCLEDIEIWHMPGFEFVGREFLGIEERGVDIESPSNAVIVFPKLKRLTFESCRNWKEWEDITAEEEQHYTIMPCLEKLAIRDCPVLMKLPHTLLSKEWPLETLYITDSEMLQQHCRENGVAFIPDQSERPFRES